MASTSILSASSSTLRLRALIAALSRGGLRISEALALTEADIDAARGRC